MIAPEGRPFILFPVLCAAGFLLLAVILGSYWTWILFALAMLVLAFTAYFFRDPRREGPRGHDLVLAAGDGRVIAADTVEESFYLEGRARRISVFLSLFDVHVNRYPVDGVVELRARRAGGFEPAWRETASSGNEQVSVGIRTPGGERVLVRQVAGLVARRIVNPAKEGMAVEQGGRMGMIRFGSRVDLFLPPDAEALVGPGDRAVGGVTIVARLHQPGGQS